MSQRLKTSIDQYRQILDHTRQLECLLVDGAQEQLQGYLSELEKLQNAAGLHDQELLEELAENPARWQADPLYLERMQLLEQIIEMNNLLLPKIRGMMSVTASELSQVKGGRVAVTGYGQKSLHKKRSVRGVG